MLLITKLAYSTHAKIRLVEEEKLKHAEDNYLEETRSSYDVQPQAPAVIAKQANLPTVSFYTQPEEPLAAQYHSQDDFGQYSYGYSNEDSFKNEQRTADGTVRGSYSYVDANGKLQVGKIPFQKF